MSSESPIPCSDGGSVTLHFQIATLTGISLPEQMNPEESLLAPCPFIALLALPRNCVLASLSSLNPRCLNQYAPRSADFFKDIPAILTVVGLFLQRSSAFLNDQRIRP
jgi:hypothetical protein